MNNDNLSYYQNNGQGKVINNETGLRTFFNKMYSYMGLALLVSGLTAYLTYSVFPSLMYAIASSTVVMLIVVAIEIGLVVMINTKAMRSAVSALPLLVLFSVVNGLTLSVIFARYTNASLLGAFVGTAAIFVAMSAYGHVTKKSMNGLGSHLFGLLIGLLVASVVNIFLQNSMVTLFLSWASVVIFSLLSMYDTNKMKQLYLAHGTQANMTGLAVSGALNLYLDFVNIFLSLLQIFGGSRD